MPISRLIDQAVEVRRLRLARLAHSSYLREPGRLLSERQQEVDRLEVRLLHYWQNNAEQRRARISKMAAILSAFRPDRLYELKRRELASLHGRLGKSVTSKLNQQTTRLSEMAKMIRLLGPQQTLERGYSITLNEEGHVLRSAQSAAAGDKLLTRLSDGQVNSIVS